ncbi:unnamed protein product [Paramecium sonneborni]|uniref:Uncharacterized protein n=1 Tax=Paramecium sonneborni TaxID=65129 RepID=A0A8S1K7J5_9CILI|nr:unnamed protein product [Paramecium sonneborni]
MPIKAYIFLILNKILQQFISIILKNQLFVIQGNLEDQIQVSNRKKSWINLDIKIIKVNQIQVQFQMDLDLDYHQLHQRLDIVEFGEIQMKRQ